MSKYFSENPNLDEIIIQSGMYHSLRKDQRLGIIDSSEVQRNLNQLRLNILEFVRCEKENQESLNGEDKQKKGRYDSLFKQSLARLCVLCILKKEEESNGLTIKELQEKSKTESRMWIVKSLHEMEEYGLLEKLKIGKFTNWKLTKTGLLLAEKMKKSLLFEKLI